MTVIGNAIIVRCFRLQRVYVYSGPKLGLAATFILGNPESVNSNRRQDAGLIWWAHPDAVVHQRQQAVPALQCVPCAGAPSAQAAQPRNLADFCEFLLCRQVPPTAVPAISPRWPAHGS